MSDRLALSLSIDLAAELVSITERQHLNKVHWAVQLVRHALEHRPRHVSVRTSYGRLGLSQDGDGLCVDEHRLLLLVTGGPDAGRHDALAELERRFGVTLLSLLLTSKRVEILGRLSLVSEDGRVIAGPPSPTPGYRVRIWRSGGSPREEEAELRFYCRHATVPLTLNGKPLNTPLVLERAVLSRPFRSDDGSGLIGLPARGSLTKLRYFKRGVYFGVRQSLPSGGRPVTACFDATAFDREENFERSVDAANQAVRVARRQLYADLPALFPEMTPTERARVKDLALASPPARLSSAFRGLPLFGTSTSSWRLSLDDLLHLARRFGRVPYLPRPRGDDDELPVLSMPEVAAVSRLLAVPVQRALSFGADAGVLARVRQSLRQLLSPRVRRSPGRPLPDHALDDDTRALLDALSRARPDVRFLVTHDGAPVLKRGRVRCLYLPASDPRLRRAVARYRERPEELDVIGASLFLTTL